MKNKDDMSRICLSINAKINARRKEADAIFEETDQAEEALDEFDVDTLLAMDYISSEQAEALREIRAKEVKEEEDLLEAGETNESFDPSIYTIFNKKVLAVMAQRPN